jgi:hypothetical protein
MDSAKKRSAAVLPSVGAVYKRPAVAHSAPTRWRPGRLNITPVASTHAAENAAWSCRTGGPSKRTLVSRHEPLLCPSPSHLSSIPNPPVQPTSLSMTIPRTCERFCARCNAEIRMGRKGSTTMPTPVMRRDDSPECRPCRRRRMTSTRLPGAIHAPVAIVAMSGNSGSCRLERRARDCATIDICRWDPDGAHT